jgi:putative hemolysin
MQLLLETLPPKNCIEKGGTLEILKRGDGGEYGVCFFEDNR